MRWTNQIVDQTLAATSKQLTSLRGQGGPAIIGYILKQIRDLQKSARSEDNLKTLAFIFMALSHQARASLLKAGEVEELVQLATTILEVHGLRTPSSRLNWLNYSIHMLYSQCLRRQGLHEEALWEQFSGIHFGSKKDALSDGAQLQVLSIRLLRLGHARAALEQFRAAKEVGVPETHIWHLETGIGQALFFSGDLDATREQVAHTLQMPNIPDDFVLELRWMECVLNFLADRNIHNLLTLTRAYGTHHDIVYVLDALMFAYAAAPTTELPKLPRMAYLRRAHNRDVRATAEWGKIVEIVQNLEDDAVPTLAKIESLRQAFRARSRLLTIDKELLLLYCALRWSTRNKIPEIATYARLEIVALSLKLSCGALRDVWGLLRE